ncbi:NADH-quinone oxidoreductase subunit C [Sulfobacillus sp. hq2]|uniref:hydrogenase large subunit n=1 Tax=Sulfobacillus sp. hq2 TaxID=2039167 RepID=UPI000CD063DC|nr:NADH-quinone oxidoreductase subunit C [Sulfobacillus sp. hq2]POB11325.1 NADH-ubiquinone oxidoreductase [Sulfobacillus sp. hq2]
MQKPQRRCEPAQWIQANEHAKQAKSHLLALTAYSDRRLRSDWLKEDGDMLTYEVDVADGTFPSLTPSLPEVSWDEREIHDLFGYIPQGHPDMRPLIRTPRWPRKFFPMMMEAPQFVPDDECDVGNPPRVVDGDGVTIMTVGPTHAGIIESGHFVFSIMGENVLHLDLHLFQNHRGVESWLQGLPVTSVAAVVSRICGADTVSHQVNWTMAVEHLAGQEPRPEVVQQRLLLLESERVLNHLNDLAQIPAGVGFAVANQRAMAMKEMWQRAMHQLTGHRLLFDTVSPHRTVRIEPSLLLTLIAEMRQVWAPWRKWVEGHHGFQDRMAGTGVVTQEEAWRLGAQGVVARASGLGFDARLLTPGYGDLDWTPACESRGDVAARFRVRLHEVEESWRILEQVARNLIGAPDPESSGVGAILPDLSGDITTYTESPHGLNAHVISLDHGRVRRYHVRSGTFRNWPLMVKAVSGGAVGDFPLINKSFELCYSCTDR